MVTNIEPPLIGADYWFEKLNITDRLGNPLRPGDKILIPFSNSTKWGTLYEFTIESIRSPNYNDRPWLLYAFRGSRETFEISYIQNNSIKIQ